MASDVIGSNFRSGTIAALVTLTVMGLGNAFKITGTTPQGAKVGGSGSVLQVWSNSGGQVGILYGSGSLNLSGSLVAKTNLSGASLNVNGTKSQGVLCRQTGGIIGACSNQPAANGHCVCAAL